MPRFGSFAKLCLADRSHFALLIGLQFHGGIVMRHSILRTNSLARRTFVALCVAVSSASTCCSIARAEDEKPAETKKHKLDPAIRLAKASQESIGKVQDYVAKFQKKERIGGRLIVHTMTIKQRREPFSVYLRFIGQHEGREVIYVDGMNEGKLLAHETGIGSIVGTIPLLPTSTEAMSESVHPITDIGMWNLIGRIVDQWEAEKQYDDVVMKYYPNAKLGDKTECKVIETTQASVRPHCKYYRTRLYIDKKTNFPVRVEQFAFPAQDGAEPPIAGEYQYSDIRVNQELSEVDFDTRNPKYGF